MHRILHFAAGAAMLPALLAVAEPVLAQTRADPEAAVAVTKRSLVLGRQHMIVTANPHASRAGAAMLDRGGSAADAAIAALLVLNVVEPQSSGIGGGAFAVVHDGTGPVTLDARETAPAGATPGMFVEGGKPMRFFTAVHSGRSIGVPGLVRLFETLHARHGRLAWADLFRPAIALARDGFRVSPRLAGLLSRYRKRFAGTPEAAVFLPGGTPLAEGALFRQPALAATLQRIAREGPNAFYTGEIARTIVAAAARAPRPGALAPADLAAYRVIERPAVCHPFRGFRVCGMGPPSSGATTVGQILMILDTFKPSDRSLSEPYQWHQFAEASRLAYADRAMYLADPDHVKVPVKGLLDRGYIMSRARQIHGFRAAGGRARAGRPPWREGRLYAPDTTTGTPGTTHLSVIDRDGLALSITASIETAFGSGRMAAGFLLNNQLTDFSFRPKIRGRPVANAVAPGKRPRSSMAPTIVYRGERPVVLTGSPGGSRIPEYVAQSLLAMLAYGRNPAEAAAMPHLSHRNRGKLVAEPGFPDKLLAALRRLGHKVELAEMTSGLHIIRIGMDGSLEGGADPRREGLAIGR